MFVNQTQVGADLKVPFAVMPHICLQGFRKSQENPAIEKSSQFNTSRKCVQHDYNRRFQNVDKSRTTPTSKHQHQTRTKHKLATQVVHVFYEITAVGHPTIIILTEVKSSLEEALIL